MQPRRKEREMSRYIKDTDVYKLIEPNGMARVHCSQIDELPRADVVEVVRCKDCLFWNTDKKGFSDECVCRRFSVLNVCDKYTLPTDFCSYGERR